MLSKIHFYTNLKDVLNSLNKSKLCKNNDYVTLLSYTIKTYLEQKNMMSKLSFYKEKPLIACYTYFFNKSSLVWFFVVFIKQCCLYYQVCHMVRKLGKTKKNDKSQEKSDNFFFKHQIFSVQVY